MRRGVFVFWSLFAAVAAIRICLSFGYAPPDAGSCIKSSVSGFGRLVEEPVRTDVKQVLVVSAEAPECVRGLEIRLQAKPYPRFVYGDRVFFSGKLLRPFDFKSADGRSFDYRGYLAKDDIFYEMKSAAVSARAASSSAPFSLQSFLYGLRRRFVANLQSALGEPQAALAAGLVVGEKSALGKSLIDDFRTVGLIHIVVLSGYNIAIVGVALRKALSFLPRAWGIILGGAGIGLFGLLVGGGATVARSCFMAGTALFADLVRRDYSVPRALGFAGLVMLVQNPMILAHDPSFQLSFLATLGLILFAGPIEARLGRIPERFGVRGTVASTLATQLSVSPYILYMMGQLSLIGIIVNLLVLPFVPLTMLAVFLTGALGFLSSTLSFFVGWAAHGLLSYELFMVESFARIPFAAIRTSLLPGWCVIAIYGAMLSAVIFSKLRRRFGPFGSALRRPPS